MTKQEFMAMSLPYGLKAIIRTENQYSHNVDHYMYQYICDSEKDESLYKYDLILRPLSDLTKPIEHNGETFVPIVELAKIADMNVTDDFKCVEHYNNWGVRFKDEDDECIFYEILAYSSNTNSFSTQTIRGEDIISERALEMTLNQLQLFQKLTEWHFNIMDESEPFIDVNTLETNPYK